MFRLTQRIDIFSVFEEDDLMSVELCMQYFTVMHAIESLGKGLWEYNIAWLVPKFQFFLFTVLLIIEIWT